MMNKIKTPLTKIFTLHFQRFFDKVRKRKHLRYVAKGGRNSAKSTHIAMIVILLVMRYPITFLVVRKVGNTLRESVFEQLKEAIEMLGVGDKWEAKASKLELIYLPRGNKIIFRGADDPMKIKSIKMSKYPIAGLWIEEAAEFKTEAEISTIEKSIIRAKLKKGLFYIIFISYNPPKRRTHWLNKKYNSHIELPNTYVDHSTYLDNPYLSKETIQEAEIDREYHPKKYQHEWLGEAVGSGVVPFENLVFRRITDEELKTFDNFRQGNDFGYANDPNAFVRWHYDKKKRTIYAVDEIYGLKMSNRELAKQIKARGYDSVWTKADSSEPKSINEIVHQHGIRKFKGAKKGPDSVEYGERWLDDLDAIVIDPKRTPNIAREFENIDYEVDRDGNPKSRLIDKDNHTIDGTRYAFEDDMIMNDWLI